MFILPIFLHYLEIHLVIYFENREEEYKTPYINYKFAYIRGVFKK